jgi:hypothetical protein
VAAAVGAGVNCEKEDATTSIPMAAEKARRSVTAVTRARITDSPAREGEMDDSIRDDGSGHIARSRPLNPLRWAGWTDSTLGCQSGGTFVPVKW